MSCRRKQIIKGVKFLLRNSVGLGRINLKSFYHTTNSWCAKLASSGRKCFIKNQEWKSDSEVINKQDDFYAIAWECDSETPIFDTDNHSTAPPDPPEIAVRSDVAPEERWNPLGTSRECSPIFVRSEDGLCDGTDTYQYKERDASNSITLFLPIPAVENTIYLTIRSLNATTTDIECLTQHQ